jgi:hypothetical protein
MGHTPWARDVRRATVVLLLISSALGCATTQIKGSATASIEQAVFSVGDRQYQLDACSSGDLQHFLGVDLTDPKGGALVRLVIDPLVGPRLRVAFRGAGARGRVWGPEQCPQLEAEARPTGWEVNTVRDVSGFVDAECRSDDEGAIRLHVRFSHCH